MKAIEKNAKEPTEFLNTRLPAGLKRRIKVIASLTGYKVESITLDAFRWFYGHRDPEIEARRKRCLQASEKLGELSPFERPLTPFNGNAMHNGIVGVAGSSPAGSIPGTGIAVGRQRSEECECPVVPVNGRALRQTDKSHPT